MQLRLVLGCLLGVSEASIDGVDRLVKEATEEIGEVRVDGDEEGELGEDEEGVGEVANG